MIEAVHLLSKVLIEPFDAYANICISNSSDRICNKYPSLVLMLINK